MMSGAENNSERNKKRGEGGFADAIERMTGEGFGVTDEMKQPEETTDKSSFATSIEDVVSGWLTALAKPELLQAGYSYLVEDESLTRGFDVFICTTTEKDSPGLFVTRIYPERFREKYELGEVKVVWLTNVENENALKPTELEKLRHLVTQELEDREGVVVLIEGIEYLLMHNPSKSVIKVIQYLRDRIAMSKSILVLSVTPSAVDNTILKLLEHEVDKVL
jgi:hypothetical protein